MDEDDNDDSDNHNVEADDVGWWQGGWMVIDGNSNSSSDANAVATVTAMVEMVLWFWWCWQWVEDIDDMCGTTGQLYNVDGLVVAVVC